jgi:hypothetical protein
LRLVTVYITNKKDGSAEQQVALVNSILRFNKFPVAGVLRKAGPTNTWHVVAECDGNLFLILASRIIGLANDDDSIEGHGGNIVAWLISGISSHLNYIVGKGEE